MALMPDITAELVSEIWHELMISSSQEVGERLDRFRQIQPILAGYVRAVDDGIFANDDRGSVTLYALWAFEVCRRIGRARREIDESTIESMLVENERLLDAMEAAPLSDVMGTAASWTESYPHLPLLGAILHQAMQGELEETRQVDDFLGLLILHMKTVVDCLRLD
jgi:hypothetical protein